MGRSATTFSSGDKEWYKASWRSWSLLLRGELRDVVIALREAAAKKSTLRPVLTSLLAGDSYSRCEAVLSLFLEP